MPLSSWAAQSTRELLRARSLPAGRLQELYQLAIHPAIVIRELDDRVGRLTLQRGE